MSRNKLNINNNYEIAEKTSITESTENYSTTTVKTVKKKKKLGILSSFRKSKKEKQKRPHDLDLETSQRSTMKRQDSIDSPGSVEDNKETKQEEREVVEDRDAPQIDMVVTNGDQQTDEQTEVTLVVKEVKETVTSTAEEMTLKTTETTLTHTDVNVTDKPDKEHWLLRKQVTEVTMSSCSESTNASPTKGKRHRASSPRATHMLTVRLLSGEHLAARDANGLSDPYVKFKYGGRTVYKSKTMKHTLEPKWNEKFSIAVNHTEEMNVRVFDRDTLSSDDFMGAASLKFNRIPEEEEKEVRLVLEDPENEDEELGSIHVAVTLEMLSPHSSEKDMNSPQSELDIDSLDGQLDRVHKFERSDSTVSKLTTSSESRARYARALPVASATVQLVSGSGLPACDSNGFSDPYVKLQVGKQRYRSKVCPKTLNPSWQEEFIFSLQANDSIDRESSLLELCVYDKDNYRRDDFIGRCELDLWSLEFDQTHSCSLNLIDAPGSIFLLVTVHSIQPSERKISMLELGNLQKQYSVFSSFNDLNDVGFLEIKVLSASNLRGADIGGKSDPFCIIDLCNARAQTHTCYKTLDPQWNRSFTFPVSDIHESITVKIYDEDKDNIREFLGMVSIPLLAVWNGQTRTYPLKDRKLQNRSKGTVTLACNVFYNPVRASIRTFSPREENFMFSPCKFKTALLKRNFQRTWRCIQAVVATGEFINSCFTWKQPIRSAMAFLAYILIVWNFELYLFPVALLLLLMRNYFNIPTDKRKPQISNITQDSFTEDEDEEDSSSKLGLMQKLNAIQEILGKVQNTLDWIAGLMERIGGTFSWRVPFLSWLAVFTLSVLAVILYFIPLRAIALLWGINKFTKRLRKPNFIPNNELLDFLSRIPSNIEMTEQQVLPNIPDSPKNNKKKK